MWHLIAVFHDGKYTKPQILDALFELLSPNEFYPCYYQSGPTMDSFFVRKCPDQVETLLMKKLILKMTADVVLYMSLKMQAAEYDAAHHTDPMTVLQQLITDRFCLDKNSLDLSRLAEDQLCSDFVCRLCVPRVLTNILSLASRRYGNNVARLSLAANGLVSARGMHPLIWMKGLHEMDISNNEIQSISDLMSMPKGTIVSLWLRGNPLCASFSSASTYVNAVKEMFPILVQVDGKEMDQYSLLASQRNFLVSIDAYELTEQFVEFYFAAFDSVSRNLAMKSKQSDWFFSVSYSRLAILDAYHPKAVFTMSSNFFGMPDQSAKKLTKFTESSRNFVRTVNNKPFQNVFQGNNAISDLLTGFGSTEHDLKSFTIDVTGYSVGIGPESVSFISHNHLWNRFQPSQASITVNGVFKLTASSLNEEDLTLAFNRTFIILRHTTNSVSKRFLVIDRRISNWINSRDCSKAALNSK